MPSSSAALTEALVLSANILAQKVREITSTEEYPDAIPEGVTVGSAVVNENGGRIEIFTEDKDEEQENVLLTLVFELGAEEHMIPAGDLGYLAIPLSRWPKYEPPPVLEGGIAYIPGAVSPLTYVIHPGMAPRPFLDEALKLALPEITEIIANSFMVNIPMHDRQVEVIR